MGRRPECRFWIEHLLLLEGLQGAGRWCSTVLPRAMRGQGQAHLTGTRVSPSRFPCCHWIPQSPLNTTDAQRVMMEVFKPNCSLRASALCCSLSSVAVLALFSSFYNVCIFTCVKLTEGLSLHWMDCKLAYCPYRKPLTSNAAVVTSWPVLAVRKPFLKWQYHFPWSVIYFRFLFNTFTASLCLRYLDIIETARASKIHCQEQS